MKEPNSHVTVLPSASEVGDEVINKMFSDLGLRPDEICQEAIQTHYAKRLEQRREPKYIEDPEQFYAGVLQNGITNLKEMIDLIFAAQRYGRKNAELVVPYYPWESDIVAGGLRLAQIALSDLGYPTKRERGLMQHNAEEARLQLNPPYFEKITAHIIKP